MKNHIYILLFLTLPILSFSQAGEQEQITPDLIIGHYGISLKNKVIGNYQIYVCGPASECYGYFNEGNIVFNNTKLYFINGEARFTGDIDIDFSTLKIIDQGFDSYPEYKKRSPVYLDKDNAYSGLHHGLIIDKLDGYKYFKGHFLIKNNTLAYLDEHGLYRLTNSNEIDKTTFTPITGHFFYDKNGVYYIENGYSDVDEKKFSEYEKIQDLDKNGTLKIKHDENYCIIDNIVYDLSGNLSIIDINPNTINKFCLNDYDGRMLLFDENTVYERPYSHYSFDKVDCNDTYEKEEIYCFSKNLKSIQLIRETVYTEYHYDIKNKTLYFDAYKDLGLTEVSGNVYIIDNEYFFTDFDRFSSKLESIKIWNHEKDTYEELDRNQYKPIHKDKYWYKGDLYGNHSKLIQKGFSTKNIRVLNTNDHYYILNNDMIFNLEIDNSKLNLNSLKVLKSANGEASNYLIGDDFLIYDNQVIKNLETKNIKTLTKAIIKNDQFIIISGEKHNLKDFPFEIVLVE